MVDYDEIRSGRRREWWKRREAERQKAKKKLLPIEQMEKLIQEADAGKPTRKRRRARAEREEETPEDFGLPGPPPDPSLLDSHEKESESERRSLPRHRSRFDRERARDRQEWEKTRRQLTILGIIAGIALLALIGVSTAWRAWSTGREETEVRRLMQKADEGGRVVDLSTPARALATYKSAWVRGDMQQVWEMTTTAIKKEILATRTAQQHIADQLKLYQSGGHREWIEVMRDYDKLEYLRKPSGPHSNGDLAVFITPPHKPSAGSRVSNRYVIAFVYVDGKWLFFEGVPETAWQLPWKTIYQAKPGASVEERWF